MNKLIPVNELAARMVVDLNRICDELEIPQHDRCKVAAAALSGLMEGSPIDIGRMPETSVNDLPFPGEHAGEGKL